MNGVTDLKVEDLEHPPEKQNGFAAVEKHNNNLEKEVCMDTNEQCKREWMLVAMVLDRLFLFLFLLVGTVVTLVILLDHPG